MAATFALHVLADTEHIRSLLVRLRTALDIEDHALGGDSTESAEAFWQAQDEVSRIRDELREAMIGYVVIGECSFLKASMDSDFDRYVPAAIAGVLDLVPDDGAVTVLTPRLITAIMVAMNVTNTSWHSKRGWGFDGMSPRRIVKRRLEALPTGCLLISSLD